jgi:predicted nucleic acid-binding protein
MTLTVVLDTSVLKAHHRLDGASFKALERLVGAEQIKVCLPEIVYRERASQLHEEQHLRLSQAARHVDEAKRWAGDEDRLDLEHAATAIARTAGRHREATSNQALDALIANLQIEILRIEPEHTSAVMGAYFKGLAPFRSVRSRDDIPDGFVVEAIRCASAKYSSMRVISADKRLTEAITAIPEASVFASMPEFLASDEVQALVEAANANENLEALAEGLRIREGILHSYISEALVDALNGFEIESPTIPDDNSTATIQGAYDPSDLQVDADEVEFLGGGSILVPIMARCEADVYYYIFKSEYFAMGDEESKKLAVTDWNDHYFFAEQRLPVVVNAMMAVELPGLDLAAAPVPSAQLFTSLDSAVYSIEEVTDVAVEE